MKAVRDLVEEFGANGIIRVDAGNGSAGPMWLDWETCKDEVGHIEMYPVEDETLNEAARPILGQPDYEVTYASDWVVGDGQTGDNPWRFRLVF